MSNPTPPPDPSLERVTFIQNQLPGLDAGVYRLTVEQHVLEHDQTTPVSNDAISRDFHLAVGGPRFRFTDPATTMSSVFPASTATGDFHTVLPHVVLATPALPWIRTPQGTSPDRSLLGEADVASWLAVLIMDTDDVAAAPGLVLEPAAAIIGDLFPAAVTTSRKLPSPPDHSYFDDATDTSGLEPGEAASDPIQVIDVPLALFAAIAPSLPDLALNSHVRQLSLLPKPTLLGAEPSTDPLGTFAIVIGNRLPQDLQTSHAYLVSLEGLAGFLPADDAPSVSAATGSLRLAVLAYWTFVSQGDPMNFTDTLLRLNQRTLDQHEPPQGPDAAVTTLRLPSDAVPVAGVGASIHAALDAGNAPLAHTLRTAETAVSWYRGPLSPLDVPAAPDLPVPFSGSDAALVFDPTTGLLDASYAAAWSIGRLIALQDKGFSTALYRWKHGLTTAIVDAAERELITEILGETFATEAEPTAKPLLHATMRLLADRRQP